MLFRFTPEEMRLVIIDPKMVEMQAYQSLPHLAFPIVTDPKKVLLALRWLIDEMERRYKMFARAGVRNIVGFNGRPKKKTQKELDTEAVESGVSPDRARGLLSQQTLRRSRCRAKTRRLFLTKFRTSS